ncbi:MAG: Smr/MutS family protein [Saprospiraceae bacterium]|nr:MAG: Smr domain-containing protein [Bacteroidetes bacterium OLB9]MCO6463493.1 Smr/MutS family protein [Saprospiraceae bacterium]MCZ2338534.1 Smr/MutS family protein [Chitinophagales bacterium]
MIRLRDLWIGDVVRIISSGKIGKFEGIHPTGKARIAHHGKILLVKASNLELVPEKELIPDFDLFYDEDDDEIADNPIKKLKTRPEQTLDLHIEKLAPHMKNEPSGKIIEYQLQQSEIFIKNAIEYGLPQITIIHGKGQGVLREAIEHQLKMLHQVKFFFTKNGGGAVDVLL